MPYRKYQKDYHGFAKQVLAEMPRQIKDFFEKRNIIPNNFKSATSNKREYELLRRRKRFEKIRIENPYLKDMRTNFLNEIVQLGFSQEDVEMIINKGLHSFDRNLAVDQLSQLKTNPDILFEEKEKRRKIEEKIKKEEEQKKLMRDKLNMFDDERDVFQYEMPLLAPKDFKPLKKHRNFCKVCYESKIDTAIIPCVHCLFCITCT